MWTWTELTGSPETKYKLHSDPWKVDGAMKQ